MDQTEAKTGSGAGQPKVVPPYARRSGTRREAMVGLLFVLLICTKLFDPRDWKPSVVFDGSDNVQIAEAQRWWSGSLDLPKRVWDTALFEGRIYSHFPPMFSFVAAVVVPVWDGVPQLILFALLAVPLPFLAYRLFWLRTGCAFPTAMLTIGLICGTSLWKVVDLSLRFGQPFFVNQALATFGLLILLVEYWGKKRLWVGSLGFVVAALSRQITFAYALVLLAMAISGRSKGNRGRRILAALTPCVLVAGVHLSFNYAKFGNPLDNGYLRIYEGRDDALAERGLSTGLFSWTYIPRNLYYASLGFPEIERKGAPDHPRYRAKPNATGTGIWWTSPVLLFVFVYGRTVWRDERSRPLLISASVVFAALMCYHSAGYLQLGFNRYSLDYIPAMFAAAAPVVNEGRRRWVAAACVAWSVGYFVWFL